MRAAEDEIMDILHSLGIDPKLLIGQIVGFLVLMWAMNKWIYKPALKFLDDRRSEITATYDQLDADREEMAKTRKQYEDRLAGIEAEARERIQTAVKEAQELRASIVADAQKQAKTVVDNGRAELEREAARTFIELRRQVADLAILAATKVVGESMDDARQRALVDQYIAGVSLSSADSGARASASGADGAGPAGAA
jgi:F-type H+-transporting ATPase subunit b